MIPFALEIANVDHLRPTPDTGVRILGQEILKALKVTNGLIW